MSNVFLDTHVHALPFTKSGMDWAQFTLYPEIAKMRSIGAFCLTEHRHSAHFEELIEGIFITPRLEGEVLADGVFKCANGTLIFSGAEVSIAGGGDVGIHASPQVVLSLKSQKAAYGVLDLLAEVKASGSPFWASAHHVYSSGKSIAHLEEAAPDIDVIESPAKGYERRSDYAALAQKFAKPSVGSSDAHTWLQVGAGYTELDTTLDQLSSIAAVKEALQTSQPSPGFKSNASEWISVSKVYREYLENES